jgi:uncharacterized membrane protein
MTIITNDAVVFGLLAAILALVFYTEKIPHIFWKKFYTFFPPILLCYFLPGLLNSTGVISGEQSKLYSVSSNFLLPACLVFFTINIDFRALRQLGPKALLVFLAGTAGVMIGGPLALWIVKNLSPDTFAGPDEVWRGLATIAGSWIGGSANQTALQEMFQPSQTVFSQAIAVDVLVAELWLAALLVGASRAPRLDAQLGADTSQIDEIKEKIAQKQQGYQRITQFDDLIFILFVGFGCTAAAHFLADLIVPFLKNNYPFLSKYSLTSGSFWVIMLVTIMGLLLSQTSARQLDRAGMGKFGSLFLYLIIASIGMKMDLRAVVERPALFLLGFIWISVHILFVVVSSRWLRAPFFFTAVGSQANIGGAASASVVAAAFHPSLAPVGVLLSILGYALGTYCGYLTGLMMQWVSGM